MLELNKMKQQHEEDAKQLTLYQGRQREIMLQAQADAMSRVLAKIESDKEAVNKYCSMERSNFAASRDTALQTARVAMEMVISNREEVIQRNLDVLNAISPPAMAGSPQKS